MPMVWRVQMLKRNYPWCNKNYTCIMERWEGRVAVVTGSSSGIGAAITQELVKKGLKVVGLARRVEKVQELSQSLKSEKGELHPVKCDITNDEERKMAFEWVKTNLGGVDILVNNAGLAIDTPLIDGSPVDLKNMLILNVLALTLCTQEALKSMKDNGVDDGHIIHINSCGGHVPPIDHYAMYFATKHAVTALTEGLRKELMAKKSNIRVTSLSPGLVKTDMVPDKLLKVRPYIQAENIADALLYILSVPADVQIQELTIKPIGAPF